MGKLINIPGQSGNNEFILDGHVIHDSWDQSWPKVVSRAWDIEYRWKKKHGMVNYLGLQFVISDGVNELIEHLIETLKVDISDEAKYKDEINSIIGKLVVQEDIKIFNGAEAISFKGLLAKAEKTRWDGNLDDAKKEDKAVRQAREAWVEQNKQNELFKIYLQKLLDEADLKLLKQYYEVLLKKFQIVDKNKNLSDDFFAVSDDDELWYKKLLSFKSEMVLDALKDEGFIVDAMENIPFEFERNVSTRILVRKADQECTIDPKRTSSNYKRIQDRTTRIRNFHHRVAGKLTVEGLEEKGGRMNGWNKVKGLGHVLICTLPPCPNDASEFALAVTDYEASGYVYPFTGCC